MKIPKKLIKTGDSLSFTIPKKLFLDEVEEKSIKVNCDIEDTDRKIIMSIVIEGEKIK